MIEVFNPRKIVVAGGAAGRLPAEVAALGGQRPLVVTDAYLARAPAIIVLLAALRERFPDMHVHDEVAPDPTSDAIEAAVRAAVEARADCVVAIGGGSPIDAGKAVAVLAGGGSDLRSLRVPKVVDGARLPLVAVPTTAGTGSEATRFVVVTDSASGEKYLCAGPALVPDVALVDWRLTLTLPPRATADTGLDALTHAIEAYVSRRSNAYSDALARAAIPSIHAHVRRAVADPADEVARERMMEAATLAGMAFSSASVALVHGMSRPLGAHFHVPHGLGNAMLLPVVTRFSIPGARGRYADCARLMGLSRADDADDQACAALVAGLETLNRDLAVPTPTGFGIVAARWREMIPRMVDEALASGSPANNPREPSRDELAALYEEAFA